MKPAEYLGFRHKHAQISLAMKQPTANGKKKPKDSHGVSLRGFLFFQKMELAFTYLAIALKVSGVARPSYAKSLNRVTGQVL